MLKSDSKKRAKFDWNFCFALSVSDSGNAFELNMINYIIIHITNMDNLLHPTCMYTHNHLLSPNPYQSQKSFVADRAVYWYNLLLRRRRLSGVDTDSIGFGVLNNNCFVHLPFPQKALHHRLMRTPNIGNIRKSCATLTFFFCSRSRMVHRAFGYCIVSYFILVICVVKCKCPHFVVIHSRPCLE